MSLFRSAPSGQYLPGSSPVHRLDPRAKLAACLLGVAACFWPGRGWAVAAPWPLLALGLTLSSVSWAGFLRRLRPFFWLAVFSVALHGLTTPGTTVPPFPWGPLLVTREGMEKGALVGAQLATGAAFSSLLTLTTSPSDLVGALTRLFAPLHRLGVPVGEFFHSILIALRFLPVLQHEADRLALARRAAGTARGTGVSGRLRDRREFASTLLRQTFVDAEAVVSRAALAEDVSDPPAARPKAGVAELVTVGLGLATLAFGALLEAWR